MIKSQPEGEAGVPAPGRRSGLRRPLSRSPLRVGAALQRASLRIRPEAGGACAAERRWVSGHPRAGGSARIRGHGSTRRTRDGVPTGRPPGRKPRRRRLCSSAGPRCLRVPAPRPTEATGHDEGPGVSVCHNQCSTQPTALGFAAGSPRREDRHHSSETTRKPPAGRSEGCPNRLRQRRSCVARSGKIWHNVPASDFDRTLGFAVLTPAALGVRAGRPPENPGRRSWTSSSRRVTLARA